MKRFADRRELLHMGATWSLERLMKTAAEIRDAGSGNVVTYSPKVFIPLTELCRDVCHYCTYAKTPKRTALPYLGREQVLEIATAGKDAGCREALFTLGDKPELRYKTARDALVATGHDSTVDYLADMAEFVRQETGLLPHLNAGVMSPADYSRLRATAPSMGMMLETSAPRLSGPGEAHYGSPDKVPSVRLESIRAAGEASVPFTSGILIGIGETREERIDSLLALRELHVEYGHIQEIIIQNFVPKPGTKMAMVAPPSRKDLLWTVAIARHIFGPNMSIQVPPNLNAEDPASLIHAGINDWGGVSRVTPDHVNPESPWPHLKVLTEITAAAGKILVPRLTVYPSYIRSRHKWIDPALIRDVLRHTDSDGLARGDGREQTWAAGKNLTPPWRLRNVGTRPKTIQSSSIERILDHAGSASPLDETDIVTLFRARGSDVEVVCEAADRLRHEVSGDDVTYVVNRNINYTNVCLYKCTFCAFSKGKARKDLRGAPYVVDLEEITRRSEEAWNRGATEVCLQGGIHPAFTGQTYLEICRAAKEAAADIHVHAFSPLEVTHGAETMGISIGEFLKQLKAAGLGTLPGTAAEILDDEIRRIICPDKLDTRRWLKTIATAHGVGLRSTATIMFGHLESSEHWARHLLAIRRLQEQTGGITEFVPLPYVHMEAPMHRRGLSRPGPTYRETILMHAVARLVLHPLIPNIQASWVKLGQAGIIDCLNAGANDLGGTLMNESISRAAGASHGQEMPPQAMDDLIKSVGRVPRQRTTLYGEPPPEREIASLQPGALAPVHNRHARDFGKTGTRMRAN